MQSFWSALKHKVHEKEKEELEQQLNNCSNQINLQLTFLNRISLQALVDSASDNATKSERLRESIDALRQSVHTTITSGEIEEQTHRLMGIQEAAVTAILQARIVNSLAFEGMYGRSDTVEEAHSETFRWILDEDSAANTYCDAKREEMRRAASEKFIR